MSFGPIDLLFNIVVALFWFRIWNRDERVAVVNPYMASVARFTQPVLDLFRVRQSGFPGWSAAVAVWLVLILFRGLALPSLNPEGVQDVWLLRLGFASVAPAACASRNILLYIAFSFLSFGIFLFQVWGFALMFLKGYRRGQRADNPGEFLWSLARPFSDAPYLAGPWLLLGFGMLLPAIMNALRAGRAGAMFHSISAAAVAGGQLAVAAAAGAVDLLLVLRSLLIVLIIGSWVVVFTASEPLMIMCREWLDFLLGPFRRFPIRLGPFDLTPIVAFMVLGIVHWLVNGNLLIRLYLVLRNMGVS